MKTPIEDQLRDYFMMVDRMQGPVDPSTPSQDTPTLSLVTENIHDTNESTMEVIMISPDRNEPSNRSRTWMFVAASVAAVALVGGLIVVADRDSDEAPADQPTVTVTDTAGVDGETAPAPDTEQSDAQDPAPEAADPEATPDPVVEQATEATPTVASSVATAGVLDGIWWKPRVPDVSLDIPLTYQFGPGDLFVLDGRAQLTAPVFRGRYTFADDVVTYFDNEIADGPCPAGDQTRLAIVIVDDGEIGSEVLEAGVCSAEDGAQASMIRLSPASTAGAAITPPDGEFDDTLEFTSQLKGIWLHEGTGEVIYFHPDSTYSRSDIGDVVANPDDHGTFVLETPDAAAENDSELARVVMTSDGSSKCAAGATLTWGTVEWNQVPPGLDPPLGPIGAINTIADDSCGMSSGNQTWIHISGA